ncbi:FAD-binding monooxygenase [Fusarium oxysporum f. sp. matthiolae]|nr:FAD-binding monooxygenase [Fusarium oxysporum f. sp. matthiolae]
MGSIEVDRPTEAYRVWDTCLGEPRQLRVITIGAGAAGLNLAYQIDRHMKNIDHIIYEKNPEVGGTWYENRYPGCACDIPSHSYQFTWEPNPNWSQFYSTAPEILEYLLSVARKYELYRFVKLGHQVVNAEWWEEKGTWRVKIQDLTTGEVSEDWCNFLISGSGILNNWKWPDIPGLHSFRGELLHSAAWDANVDWKGKKVAVLGSGSSGVQIVPTIQPDVKELVTFLRSPTWITAGFAQTKAGPNGANFNFSGAQKKEFRDNPEVYLKYRKEIEAELNTRFKFIIKGSPEQAEAVRFSTNEVKNKLGADNPLLKYFLPDFSVGCRRTTPGNGYLEALTKDNVRVVTDAITEVVPEGIKTATGEIIKVDIFACATGFDISFCPRYPLIGQNGIQLGQQWAKKPKAYLSMAVPNFPNHFMFLGPNAPIGHGSVLPILEHSSKYILRMIHKCQTQGIKSVVAKKEAVDEFVDHVDEFMKRTAWSTHCRSWFKNGKVDGPVVALHPGSRIHWFHMLENPRFEDFEWKYLNQNRFAYLGNGFSVREGEGRDLSDYLQNPDEGYEVLTY